MLDNFEFHNMSANARALLPMIWLLASEDNDPLSGVIRYGSTKIAFRLRIRNETVTDALNELEQSGFIVQFQSCIESVHKPLRNSYETVTPETETETETYPATRASAKNSLSECFDNNETRLRELFPHVSYDSEKEVCIAHYASQSIIDPYQVILKWFNRIPKQKLKDVPKTFEQIKMDNTKKVMSDFIKRGEQDAVTGQAEIHSDIRGAFRSLPSGPDKRTIGNVLEISSGP
jgi:hypothetical protein